MRRTSFILSTAALVAASAMAAVPAQAAAPPTPYSISSFTPTPGPGVGEVSLSWTHDAKYTTEFVLQTALRAFDKTTQPVAPSARGGKIFTISRSVRSYTMTAEQVAAANAPVASGNHLYLRLAAVNRDASGATSMHYYPYLTAVLPRPQASDAGGEQLRISSFNVRTARATTDPRTWLERAPDVAAEIKNHNPGVVALQELGPGRADGQTGTLQGHERQTDSLIRELDAIGAQKYDLVRTTPYVSSTTPSSTQGMRILFDHDRYRLLSDCPDKTGTSSYSSSCSFKLPILSTGDDENDRRRAAYAKFEDLSSGNRFWVVSVHLDARHSSTLSTEKTYQGLRTAQAQEINRFMNELNTEKLPIIVGGDFNTWQTNVVDNGAHDTLTGNGYYDASAAVTRTNFEYKTINDFVTTMTPGAQGVGVRIDMLLVRGAPGSSYFQNVMKVTDDARPSDHNMILADIALPRPVAATSWSSVTVRSTRRG